MKIKITTPVLSYENTPIINTDPQTQEKIPLTWRVIVFQALNTFTKDESPATAELKDKCFQITTKIYATDEPDLTDSERVFVHERIVKIWDSPIICGRAEKFFSSDDA